MEPVEREELVFSLCHEVGNLVGAIRLHADAIDQEASPVELASTAVEIDDSSARIRSWLALVRPLLDRERGDEPGLSPAGLIEGVAEALEECGSRGVSVELDTGNALPAVRGRLEVLHHLLATLAFHALEEARPDGRVWLVARLSDGGDVEVSVEDDGREEMGLHDPETGTGGALTGRALALASARVILAGIGGDADASREGDRTVVRLRLAPLVQS